MKEFPLCATKCLGIFVTSVTSNFILVFRRITDDVIEKAVQEAQETENTLTIPSEDTDRPCKAIGAYRFMLTAMKGKSLLEFQELMTIFQLLNWNGSLQALRDKGLSRQHVLSHYKSRTIDDDIRSQMALDWVSRKQMNPDIVAGCYEKACMEIKELCLRGRELRFAKEKKEILGLALQQLGEA